MFFSGSNELIYILVWPLLMCFEKRGIMNNKIFDSLHHTKSLEEVGFSRKQAEKQVEIMGKIITANLLTKDEYKIGQLVTQKDFIEVRARMDREFAAVRGEISVVKAEMSQGLLVVRKDIQKHIIDLKLEISKSFNWTIGINTGIVGLMLVVLGYYLRT
jgi:hypothetical protein